MKHIALLLIILVFYPATKTNAQTLDGELKFIKSRNSISQLLIKGNDIYLGTANGLIIRSSNGKKTKHYPIETDSTIKIGYQSGIKSMDFDKKGKLWVSLWDGTIRKFNGKSWEKPFTDSVRTMYIAFDKSGNLWTSWREKETYLFKHLEKNVQKADSIPPGNNIVFKQHKGGRYWCGTSVGLSYKEADRWKFVPGSNGEVRCIYEHPHTKDLWFGLQNNIYQWDGKELKTYEKVFKNAYIYGIISDSAGDLWLLTNTELVRWNSAKPYESYTIADKFWPNAGGIAIDKKGNFWLAGLAGLYSLDNGKWKSYYEEGIQGYSLSSYLFDSKNRLWLGSNNHRLACKTNENWDYYELPDSKFYRTFVYDIVEAKDGTIWAATYTGLYFFNGLKWETVLEFKDCSVSSIVTDKDNTIFVLANNEIYRKEGDSWQPIGLKDLKFYFIRHFYIDAHHNIWIHATDPEFVESGDRVLKVKMNDKHIAESYQETLEAEVNCFFEDHEKNLWIGTSRGAFVLNNDKWVAFDKLYDPNKPVMVNGICQDSSGAMWFMVGRENVIVKMQDNILRSYHTNLIGQMYPSSDNFRIWGNGVSFRYWGALVIFVPE